MLELEEVVLSEEEVDVGDEFDEEIDAESEEDVVELLVGPDVLLVSRVEEDVSTLLLLVEELELETAVEVVVVGGGN